MNPLLAERVRSAAQRLDYRPNALARNLRKRRSRVLALIISDIENPFFTAVARGVEDVAQSNGFSVFLCNADENPEKEARYLEIAAQERVAGVVLSPHSSDTDVSELISAAIPVVTIDRFLSTAVDSVVADSQSGARDATLHLLDEGWSNPACVTGPVNAITAIERASGYRAALSERGRESVTRIVHRDFRVEGGSSAALELLDSANPPDSFFSASANLTLGIISALTSAGVVIGRDVGLVSFDDAPWATLIDPPLTVVSQPAYEIGRRAAVLLMQRVVDHTGSPADAVTLETDLIVRRSSRRQR
ncbi:LacI family DNA-binding transcriptional regulator [Microbacterium soli]|uniref:LacI family DNA-binding transcriptional regulator n=1 Tax=Microbacterium soli TaxID=446075 RepID=A0ABP7N533_9MICO